MTFKYFRATRSLLILSIILTGASVIASGFQNCSSLLRLGTSSAPNRDQVLKSFDEIGTTVRHWILNRQSLLNTQPKFKLKAGDALAFNDGSYNIIALLGIGSESVVYLIETQYGLRVAKVFNSSQALLENLKAIEQAGAWGNLPKVEAGDISRGILMLEYIDGIPVRALTLFRGPDPLSIEERKVFENSGIGQIRNLERTAPKSSPFNEGNAVFIPRTGHIRVIDPS